MKKEIEYDFLTVGPVSWDTNALTRVENLNQINEVVQRPGGTVDQPGGTAVNVAYALKTRLPGVGVCGVTGSDPISEIIRSNLDQAGIDTRYVRHDINKTPRSISFVTNDGEKHIVYDGDGLETYNYPEEIFREAIVKTPWAYFSIARFSQFLLPIAKELDVRIATDIQAPKKVNVRGFPGIQHAEVVFLSSANLRQNIATVIREIWTAGPSYVVVTQSDKGAILGIKNKSSIRHYDAIPTQHVLDTTGAGDVFAAIFCASLSSGETSESSLEYALRASSEHVQKQGSLYCE